MLREQEQRHVYYDRDLGIEAYQLSGIVQKFPNHFHDYYVIGAIEGGKRHLFCKNQEYDMAPGDVILFNPRDNHCCAPIDGEILDYRALNVGPDVMKRAVSEITGREFTPYFTENVVYQSDIAASVKELYDGIVNHAPRLKKEEAFYFLLEQVLLEHAAPFEEADVEQPEDRIKALCSYMEEHFSDNITLDELTAMTDLSKYHLLRSFTRQVGISPYRYLQSVRVEKAKKLLENGVAPIDAAFQAGFSDQSHFTNFFKEFIGLTPKQYQKIFSKESGARPTEKSGEGI